MQETLEKIFNILHGVWRFRWWAVITAWIIAPLGWVVVALVPNMYESKAQIYVDSQSILKPLLRGIAVESIDYTERLGMMSSTLLSRPNLEKVIRDIDLDVKANSPAQIEALISNIRSNTHIRASRTHRTPFPKPYNLYEIANRNTDPNQAYSIVASLLNLFVEDALGDTRQESDLAQSFLEKQIKEYEQKLAAAEKRLREFKRKNINTLPEQGTSFYQRLQLTQTRYDEIELQLREEQDRKHELTRQIEGVDTSGTVVGADGIPISSPLDQRINTMQQSLDELLLRYTEEHPDVLETRNALEALKNEKQQKKQMLGSDEQVNNPMYQQLRVSLSEVEANIAALKVRRSEFRSRLTKLKQQIETLPQVEAELMALNRDYQINKDNYDSLVTRKSQARISEQVEQTGEEVKLQVVEPPRIPAAPISPNRLLLTTVVLLLAFATGLGLSFLLSQLKPTFYNIKMLRQSVDVPILGSVSMHVLPATVHRRKLQLIAFYFSCGVLFIAYLVVMYLHISGALSGLVL